MKQTPKYVKEVQELLAQFDNDGNSQDKQPLDTNTPEQETDVYIEDFDEEQRITLIRKKPYSMPVSGQEEEEESELSDLDTVPLQTKPQPQPASNVAIGVWLFGLLVPLFCIAVQLYFIVNPFIVTITLLAKSQQISLQGTLQQGRVISPLTLSQSQTVPTTGRGHQDANIPPDNPPVNGQTTVSAHAVNKGIAGNISAGDINSTVAIAVLAKNTSAFYGGQDERNFQTVAKSDITNTAAPLKTTLDQSMQDTLTGQLKSGEALASPHCTPTTTTDHQTGQEATEVKVTVSETCSGIAYNTQELTSKVTQLLTSQATTKLGAGYSILESPQITITSATPAKQVTLSFTSVSTWVYALTTKDQQAIKKLIAGKNTDKALQLLSALPGIERVSLQSSGFGDSSRIPKDISSIHLLIFSAAA
jgi:hypothetical protein